MRVAVTGSRGRLGRALVAALSKTSLSGPGGPIAWSRPDFDLDAPAGAIRLLRGHRPDVVVHAAAWTDVEACAREPELAHHRNGAATGVLARMCVAEGIDLIYVSTNEVFDGRRTDGRGYEPGDVTGPLNPYGASKLAGEELAAAAFARAEVSVGEAVVGPGLAIVRTAWLFGPPGDDFPMKIIAAGRRAGDATLKVVGDEVGSPTSAVDVAGAIVELLAAGVVRGVHHVVNAGRASRADWAREVFRLAELPVVVEDVPASTWQRASTPPLWAVLEPTPLPGGVALRDWRAALAEETVALRRAAHVAMAAG